MDNETLGQNNNYSVSTVCTTSPTLTGFLSLGYRGNGVDLVDDLAPRVEATDDLAPRVEAAPLAQGNGVEATDDLAPRVDAAPLAQGNGVEAADDLAPRAEAADDLAPRVDAAPLAQGNGVEAADDLADLPDDIFDDIDLGPLMILISELMITFSMILILIFSMMHRLPKIHRLFKMESEKKISISRMKLQMMTLSIWPHLSTKGATKVSTDLC